MNEKMTIGLPSGAGDVSWSWSKFYGVRDRIGKILIADGQPRRTVPYVRCWFPREEGVEDNFPVDYGPFQYPMILLNEEVTGISFNQGNRVTWEQIKDRANLYIQPNHHLEAGFPLHEWLPDLPTYYHYPLYTLPSEAARAEKLLSGIPTDKPTIGISCASYKGADAWRTWKATEWVDMLSRIIAEGWHPVLIGGNWDELTTDVYYHFDDAGRSDDLSCIVGKTKMGEAIELLKRFDSYLGYSSGLNVIRTVLNRPAMAFWPHYDGFSQELLSRSWAPPHMQEWESGRYIARLWRPVDEVWPTVRNFLRTCDDERGRVPAAPCP